MFEGDLLTLAVGAIGAVGIVTAITGFLIAAASRFSDEGQATPPTEPEADTVDDQETTSTR